MANVALRYEDGALVVLDQTRLPFEEVELRLTGADEVAGAIRRLAVRGAPNLGIAGAYGAALARAAGDDAAAGRLRDARPTATNLAWAVDRVMGAADPFEEAQRIHAEEDAASDAIANHGADLLERHGATRLLTVCNTGALACGGRGSALAVVAELATRRDDVSVLACETRPLLQGARLTIWELRRLGIAHALIVDAAAAGLIARGEVDAVLAGFDRAAANGDVANKVGTYGLALAAAAAGIPFLVAGPTTSIDADTPTGAEIAIEERDGDEVRQAGERALTFADTPVRNPAFDVTPAALVTALVTEEGIRPRPAPDSAAT